MGREAEARAERLLLDAGWTLLARRFRLRFGELDLIFEDGPALVFVEVRCRSDWSRGRPIETIGTGKQRTIAKLALAWMIRRGTPDRECRFDVVEVCPDGGKWRMKHWKDAFRPPPPDGRGRY